MPPIPITIITGFLGSGKTTLLLSLLPQLQAQNPHYKLALVKNEFGDLAVDSQLASASNISGVRELLNGCICCNLVGSLSAAVQELTEATPGLNRIVIETSGSAFPATLAMEVNRLARDTQGKYALDGVVSVIDVENWTGYEDTSVTARIQAKYTDLMVYNKWELCDERRFDEVRDRVGDLEVDIAWVKSDRGKVSSDVVFGIDGGLARSLEAGAHEHNPHTGENHQKEVEVLSVTCTGTAEEAIDPVKLQKLLRQAPKDEVYRIKAILTTAGPLASSEEVSGDAEVNRPGRYILNWAFGRWTSTFIDDGAMEHASSESLLLRMTLILARYESTKWKKKLESGDYICTASGKGDLRIEKIV